MIIRKLVKVGVLAALLVVGALCALTAYGTMAWMDQNSLNLRLLAFGSQSAQTSETGRFAVYPNFHIISEAGNIQVTAAAVTQIEVEMVKTAWGATAAEAEDNAQALDVRVTESAGTLTLTYELPESRPAVDWRGETDTVDFIVRVPAETSVDLNTSHGRIDISGLSGDAKIKSSFGSLKVENLAGSLEAISSHAPITVDGVDAGNNRVNLKTSFGRIAVEDVSAEEIIIQTNNGNVTARSLAAQKGIEIENPFGSVQIQNILAASLQVNSSHGRILVESGALAENISLSTSFGAVQVIGVEAGKYYLSASRDSIIVEGSTGSLDLNNAFGTITVTGASNAILNLQSSHGAINFSGSLDPGANHMVKTSFGEIRLAIPADSSFDVSLDTSFGQVRSELPISRVGTLADDARETHVEGRLNNGGPDFIVTTSNGNITLQALPEE